MKRRLVILLAVALACAGAFAHDYQVSLNAIGDSTLVTLGGFTLAKPVSIDLVPTNAPVAGARYSVRCQVVYKDNFIPRPKSKNELKVVRMTGSHLNSWLRDFVASEYEGAEYGRLVETYMNGELVQDLNDRFPAYVAEQINAMRPDERFDIDTVTVSVEAEGDFKQELIKLLPVSE